LACPQHRYGEAIRQPTLLSPQAFFIHLLARDVLNNRLHSQYTFSTNTNIKQHEAKPSFLSSADKDISLSWLFTKIVNPPQSPTLSKFNLNPLLRNISVSLHPLGMP
jgi:hypothetical protein